MASGSSAMPEDGSQSTPIQPHQDDDHHLPQRPQQEQQQQQQQEDEVGPSTPAAAQAETYEAEHVHAVYEAIAPHFSATRHKPWPFVAQFLNAQPPGSVGLDVGCGNGKYLRVNPSLHLLGSDRSASLVRLAWEGPLMSTTKKPAVEPAGHGAATTATTTGRGDVDVAVADGLDLPYRLGAADFAICIAVIHHLSTPERRREAITKLLECVRPREGRVLIYVWALEQSSSRRGWDGNSKQDTLVPWVMKTAQGGQGDTYQRYYHLYRKGELEGDVVAAGGVVEESGYERDNWWVICSRSR